MSARSKSPSAWSMVSTCALRMMNSLRLGKSALAAGRTATAAPITTAALIRSRRVTLIGKATLLGCVLMVFLFLPLRVQILEQQPARSFTILGPDICQSRDDAIAQSIVFRKMYDSELRDQSTD